MAVSGTSKPRGKRSRPASNTGEPAAKPAILNPAAPPEQDAEALIATAKAAVAAVQPGAETALAIAAEPIVLDPVSVAPPKSARPNPVETGPAEPRAEAPAPKPVAAPALPKPAPAATAPVAKPAAPTPAVAETKPVEPAEPPVATPVVAAVENDDHKPSATAATSPAPLNKGLTIMATTFESTKANATEAFGEINSRAKGAMEKSAKVAEEMTEFTKGNVEAMVASSRVAAKGAESMAQDVAETMKKHFEASTAALKSFASVKSPTELFQLQSDYAKTYFDTAVADASKFSESWLKLAGDIAQPLSSRYAVAAEKIKGNAAL